LRTRGIDHVVLVRRRNNFCFIEFTLYESSSVSGDHFLLHFAAVNAFSNLLPSQLHFEGSII